MKSVCVSESIMYLVVLYVDPATVEFSWVKSVTDENEYGGSSV